MSEKALFRKPAIFNWRWNLSLGARLQMLESETQLSRGRLIRLYKELRGSPPPKGMLPFSTDWFMTWEQNIHSSMFYNVYAFMIKVNHAVAWRRLSARTNCILNSVRCLQASSLF